MAGDDRDDFGIGALELCTTERAWNQFHNAYHCPLFVGQTPNGHASTQSEISKASPEHLQLGFELFMRLVLIYRAENPFPIYSVNRERD
jgi:hypothetical protein